MAFKSRGPLGTPPSSPEEHYRDLPRRAGAVPNLWLHQGDVLRTYAADHTRTPDLALELPTGTGKTLPGLLIADWSRLSRPGQVAYACPTQQLARQVAATAERQGVPSVVLVGSHRTWPVADQSRYEAAEAVAVTTYSTVFNSHPKLVVPDVLLFDDAHAGEQYVAEAYSVPVRRWEEPAVYDALLTALSPALDGMLVQRLRDPSPDPGAHHQVRLVVPLRQPGMVEALDKALSALTGTQMFRYAMIRSGLPACLVYLTYSQVLVRPFVPPTGDNPLFIGAQQRLYLSATLGEGGELERSFGRAPIARLGLPESSPTPRSGRRFFLFPELVAGADPRRLAADTIGAAGKALVLAPDTDTAVGTAAEVAGPGWPVLGALDVADGMGPFAALPSATCGLASRYDGLDLHGDACRAVVLEGKPDQDSLQEKFLSERVRAGAALAERVRTRVVQGAGRCTRGPDDWALVVVLGSDLTRYLLRPETLDALAPELQAEIRFGAENSRDTSAGEVTDNVAAFLAQGDGWHDTAEPLLADLRRAAVRRLPPGTDSLSASAAIEIDACALAAAGRWSDASRTALDAARELGAGGDATRGYRALWLYLAGAWADQAAADGDDPGGRRTARALIAQAEQASKPGTWTRDLAPLPDTEPEPLSPADLTAVAAVAASIGAGVAAGKHAKKVAAMLAGLAARTPGQYEPELTVLGTLLGADARKPPGKGRCDSAWCWDDRLWIAVEAKSDHEPTGVVPHKDIRQANDQLRLLCTDRGMDTAPPNSATVVVSPKPAVDQDGVDSAEAHVLLGRPDTVRALARDTAAAWDDILAGRAGRQGRSLKALVQNAMERHGVLPAQVLDRLTEHRVSPRDED
jgi:hypothetical protein